MKKTLLLAGVATLIAGGAQAGELELGLEGYASVYGIYADQDANQADFGIRKEIEIDFTGETTLDNGLTIGVTLETMAEEDEVSSDIDTTEAYIYAEGGFGKVIAGQEYNAAYLMQVAAPAVDAELDGMDPTYDIVTDGNNDVDDASYAMYGDADQRSAGGDKVTYISPVWDGLQLGASYTPDTGTTNVRDELPASNTEAFSLAARYAAEDIMGADWTFGAGWNTMAKNDTDEWNIAAVADTGAWAFGASYYDYDQDNSPSSETEALALGVNYETGAFTYGVSYLNKEVGADELDRYMTGVNYAYGPGMALNGSVSYHDYDGDSSLDENDATVLAIGTVINF